MGLSMEIVCLKKVNLLIYVAFDYVYLILSMEWFCPRVIEEPSIWDSMGPWEVETAVAVMAAFSVIAAAPQRTV